MTDPKADQLDFLRRLLESKSTAKQITYKNLLQAFTHLATASQRIIDDLKRTARPGDDDVTVDFRVINEHEFHVKLAGDLLVFVLHTNVVTLGADHPVMQDPYMAENDANRYFGLIMVYNFMADSFKFNRVNDPGYLVARLLLNHENRFLVEGEGELGALYGAVSATAVQQADLENVVRLALLFAIENDLMAPPFPEVRFITLYQKLEKTQELGAGQKIGFRMSYQNKM